MRTRQRGFTLIELLIVVAIIGIIAAIAIPNLILMIQRAKQKRAMAEIRGIAMAVESYAVDQNDAPTGDGGWNDSSLTSTIQEGTLSPMYIKQIPNPDPWYDNYDYAATSTGADFGVRSLGKDGVGDSPGLNSLLSNTPVKQTVCFENDIVWVNSQFQIWPEGKQVRCM